MIDISDPIYNLCRKSIEERHAKHVDWAYIRYLANKASNANQRHLIDQLEDKFYEGWPKLGIEQWFELFDAVKAEIEDYESGGMDGWTGVATGGNASLDMSAVYDDPNSCWNRYKYKLLNITKFSHNTVKSIQEECDWIVRNLSPDSAEAVKGLVVGNVQSGKTANMSGVMAMAADLGYNFFIVLSGTITNLREQTAKRLYADLALIDKKADPKLKMSWQVLTNPSMLSPMSEKLSSLKLSPQINGDTNPNRYLTVCLKNKKRLRDLLGWLQANDSLVNTGMLKVVIIDDECDQAGVNTADVSSGDQTRIFQLIKGLCDHAKPAPRDAVKPGQRYRTANYIAYSATPYANILNDGDQKTSLFPRDFICSLPVSASYWGPSRFFGVVDESDDDEFAAFPFINEIPGNDIVGISNIHSKESSQVPSSLKDAVNWFVCASAVRRVSGAKKPVSMLVHTSNKTADHAVVAAAIEEYLAEIRGQISRGDIGVLREIEGTYNSQLKSLSLEDFGDYFPDYEPKSGSPVVGLPSYDVIASTVKAILEENVANIKLSGDETGSTYEFSKGIHLCIDNSASNAVQAGEAGEEFTLRIKYPEEGQDLSEAPLFIIVGGNTLSRGLTLEGLVCSYFLRTVRQSDSLMQMGRWFGYRFGYELLPRVWMSKATLSKFCLLNVIDLDLRRSLKEAMDAGLPPDQMIPCIQDTSAVIKGFTLTSPKKMQMAEVAEADYGGRQQVVVTYDTADEILQMNEQAVKEFLAGLGEFSPASALASSNYYVANIEWAKVKAFLQSCHISTQGRDFKNPELMLSYVEKKLQDRKWTVIVAGTAPDVDAHSFVFGRSFSVGKVGRKINKDGGSFVAFKHVTAPVDFVCDIEHDADCLPGTAPFESGGTKSSVGWYRSKASLHGKDRTPLLIINCIDKDYLNEKCGTSLTRDLFGIAFYFPRTSEQTIGSYTKLRVSNIKSRYGTENDVIVEDDGSESEV